MRRAILLCLLIACGDDDVEPRAQMDASATPIDAAIVRRDASARMDAQALPVDSGDPLPDYAECRGYVAPFHAARVSGRSFASAVSVDRIYLAYAVPTCGGSLASSVAYGLALATMKTTGPVGDGEPWISAGDADCSRTRTPALSAYRGALTAYYASDRGGSPQVWTESDAGARALTSELAAAPTDITADATHVYYARANAIYAQGEGNREELVTASEGYGVDRIATSALGPALTMIAWTSQSSARPGAFLRVLGDDAALPIGAIGPHSGLALATQSRRGIVVYSDDTGCLFARTVELDHSLGAPVRLTSGNQLVSDVALARYGIGYAIAFRATPSDGGGAVIRLLMIDELGNQARPRVISEARSDGQGLSVHVANDGRVVIAWADPGDDEITVRVARLSCF